MEIALQQALSARKHGDFPFGAVITCDNAVITSTENGERQEADVTAHAEMLAIRRACKKLGRRDLSDCVVYSSAEPCPMCSAAIFQSHVSRVVYGLSRDDLPHIFRRRKIRIGTLAKDWDYSPEIAGGVLREAAILAFDGIEHSFRVVPKFSTASA